MVWKTTLAFFVAFLNSLRIFRPTEKSILLALPLQRKGFLLLFLFGLILPQNFYSQVFIPDGNYDASEYAGAVVKNINPNASGTCEVKQVYSVVKSDDNGPYLLLGLYNGNAGKAIFRYYLDTNPNLDLVSETYKNTTYSFPGADVVLQIDTNDSSTLVYQWNGTNLVLNNSSGLIAKVGDFTLADKKFIEIKVPLSGNGSAVNLCDLAEGGIINLGSYLSFSGGSLNAAACINDQIGLDINVTGTISGGKSYCAGSSNSTTLNLTGNFGAVSKWQKNEGIGWVDIPNTANTSSYLASNVSVTTTYRALIVNNTCPDNEVETGIATITIFQTPAAPVTETITQPTCDEANGSFSVTAVDGLTYSFNGGAFGTTTSWSGLSANNYTVIAKNSSECISEELTVTIDAQPETPTAEIANNNGLDLNCSNPSTTLTASGGVSYSWSNGSSVVGTSAALEVTAAGTYTVTVTGENGCTATISETVTLDDSLPAAAIANDGLELSCNITSLTLTASGGVSYSWSNGSSVVGTSAALEVTAAKTYTVTVTGENGCTATISETVTLDDSLPAAAIANDGLELSCNITSLTLTATGGISYSWSNGSAVVGTSAVLEVTAAGTYTVTVTGENGCTATSSETVTLDDSLPAASIANEGLELSCNITSLTLTASGGVSYSWSNGSTVVGTSAALEVTEAGTYTVTVTGENGCTATASETITLDDSLPAAAIANDGLELSCSVTSTTLTASGGVSYSWSNGSSVVGTSAALEVTAAGTYTVTVTGENGCTATASETITLDDSLPAAAIANDGLELSCSVTSTTLTASGGVSYSWSNGSTVVGTSAALEVTEAGIYTVTVTGENGCTATVSETVTLDDSLPTAAIANDGLELSCNITSLPLTASGGVSYSWSNGSTVVGTSAALEVTAAGTYTVTVTGENGCIATASETVTLDDSLPAATIANEGLELSCSVNSTTLTASGGVSYSWSKGSAVVGTSAALEVTEAGIYTVTVTGDNGCTATASETVTLDDTLPTATIANEGLELSCTITSLTLTASGGVSYSWSNGSSVVGTSAYLEVTEAGTYTVTVTGENGCTAIASETVTLDDSLPAATIANDGLELTCNITSVTLTASGGVSYSWSNGSTVVGTSAALGVTEAGIYTVTVTGENGCTATASETVTLDDSLPAAAIANEGVELSCSVNSTILTASGGVSYSWSNGSTVVGTSAALEVTEAGTYTVTVTGENGCTATVSETVTLDDSLPAATIANEGLELSCKINSLTLTASGGVSYSWSNGSTVVGTSAALEVTEAGTYTMTVTGENGCTATASETVTLDDSLPSATIANEGLELSCNITALTLTATGGVSYSWSNGSSIVGTSAALEVTEAGTYTVTVTGKNGCTATASETVTLEDSLPTAAIANEGLELSCNITTLTLTASGGVSYSWSNGSTVVGTSAALEVTEAGTYTVTVTGENGCTDTASETVTLDDSLPAAAIANDGLELSCSVTSTTLTASGGVSYSWSNGSAVVGTSTALEVTEAGTYTVTVTGENGCTATASETVTHDNSLPAAAIANDGLELSCTITSLTLTASGGVSYSWSNGSAIVGTSAALEVTEAGTYTVTVTGENGCTATASETVTLDDSLPGATIANEGLELSCRITSLTLTASGGISYSWSNGSTVVGTSAALEVTEAGTYTVTVTGENGCTATASETVNIIPDTEAPVADLAKLPTVTGECSATVSVVPTATDNCGGTIQGTTTDPLTYTDQGNYKITWTFDDGNGNSSTSVQNVVVDDVTAPTAITIADATGECEVTVTAPTTSDNCSGTITGTTTDPLTYSEQGNYQITWTFDDGNGNTSTSVQNVIVDDVTAPTAITIADATGECEVTVSAPTTSDNCSGTITGTTSDPLTYNEQGNYQVTWTFDDGNGNTTTSVQDVIVDDVTAPTAITIADATGECEVTVTAPTTSDNCSGTITGTTTDPLTYSEQGSYEVTWTFDDRNGNTTTSVQKLIVDDVTAPAAIPIPDATGECEVTVSSPTTSDNCSGTITGTTTDPLTYSEQGNYKVTWTFDDGNGNTTTSVQDVIVDDVTAPTAITLADATGECEVTVTAPTTSDNCSGTITGTTTDPLTYSEQGNYKVTWTFDDGNGNTTTSIQDVIVDDVTAPTTITIADATGECEVTVTAPTTSDNCSGTITGTTTDPLTYSEQGNYKVTWTFDDGNGNTTTSVQNVIVDDTIAPTAITIADATGECEVTVTAPTTSDNCSGTITGTTTDPLTYTEQGSYEITWTFDDGNGNTTTSVQNVIVDGISAPVLADVVQPGCEVTTGSFTVTTIAGLEYTIDGENFSASGSFEGLEPGVYTVAAINEAGCLSPLTEVVINETASLPAPVIASTVQPTCEINTGSFTVTGEEGITYSIDGTNYQSGVEFSDLAPGSYNVTAQNEEGCISPATVVTIEESAVAEPIGDTTVNLCDESYDLFDLYEGIDENGVWEDPLQSGALTGSIVDVTILQVGTYSFNYVTGGNCPSTTTVEVTVNDDCIVFDCSYDAIKKGISKVVTPGTDNHNDFFVVDEDRECGFTYGIQIFNRWGAEVYSSRNYDNDWNGYSSKSVTGSNQLPSGTYFYIVQIDGGTFEPIQGYIYLGTK